MGSLRCWDGRRRYVLTPAAGCAGPVDGGRGGGGAPTNKKTPRGTGGLRVSWWADALLDNEGGAGHPCIVAHVTSRGHPFHALDTPLTARTAVRADCPIRYREHVPSPAARRSVDLPGGSMSVPTPPPERQSAYPHQTPAAAPPAVAPAGRPDRRLPGRRCSPPPVPVRPRPGRRGRAVPAPPARRSTPGATGPVSSRRPSSRRSSALVGVVIVDQILYIDLAVKDVFGTDSTGAAYVVGAAVFAVLARRAAAPARAHDAEAQGVLRLDHVPRHPRRPRSCR